MDGDEAAGIIERITLNAVGLAQGVNSLADEPMPSTKVELIVKQSVIARLGEVDPADDPREALRDVTLDLLSNMTAWLRPPVEKRDNVCRQCGGPVKLIGRTRAGSSRWECETCGHCFTSSAV